MRRVLRLALGVLLIKNVTAMPAAFHHPVAFPVAEAKFPSCAFRPRQQHHLLRGRSAGWKTLRMVRAASDSIGRQMSGSISPDELEKVKRSLWNESIQKDWESFYRTVQAERSYDATNIEGKIPVDFAASVFRNGPGRFDRGGKRFEHVLDGDGHIIKFVVDGASQRAHVSNRFVRTPEYMIEEQEGAIRFRSTFGTQAPGLINNIGNLKLKNQANTNIQFCGGRLLALWEAGLPFRLNPVTLETEDADLLDGCLRGAPGSLTVTTGSDAIDSLMDLGKAFTAHPHRDSVTGNMVGWSWAQNPVSNSLSMTLVEWEDETQEEVHRSEYVLGDCSMAPHDFAVTESFYVFVVNQLEIDLAPYMLGFKGPAQCLSCTGDGVVVHLVPRPGGRAHGTDPIVIKTQDPWFVIHHATAHEEWTEGGELAKICVYSTGWDNVSEGPFLSDWGGAVPLYDKIPATFLFKLDIDVGSGTVERSKCSGHCEHAHVHPDWEASEACRFVYACSGNTLGFSSPPTAWLRYDTRTGEEALWQARPREFVEELVVIPKTVSKSGARRNKDAADAWLAGMIYSAERDQSCLAILDAARIEEGPICRIWCQDPMPNGLHGCYSPQLFFPS